MTHYEVLGVPVGASPAEIRAAYHRQARRWHPDFHAGEGADGAQAVEARRRMQAVNEAWRVLRDPVERRRYDLRLAGTRAGSGGAWAGARVGDRRFDDPPDLDAEDRAAERAAEGRAAEERAADRERWVPAPPGRASRSRALLMAPVLLAGAAAGAGALSLVLGRAMLALAAICAVAAAVLFVVVPMMVMTSARKE